MEVHCNAGCWNCQNGVCTLQVLSISDGECEDYDEFPGNHREYQNEYWIAVKSDEDPVQTFRRKRYGLKYDYDGLVFYTNDDIREGVKNANFTEENTGVLVPGEVFSNPELLAKLRTAIKVMPNVMSYPEEKA